MKKTIFVLAIIAALAIALYKWIMSDDIEKNEENKQETTEEVKEPASEKETVKPETNAEEVKENGEDTVNENHK